MMEALTRIFGRKRRIGDVAEDEKLKNEVEDCKVRHQVGYCLLHEDWVIKI